MCFSIHFAFCDDFSGLGAFSQVFVWDPCAKAVTVF